MPFNIINRSFLGSIILAPLLYSFTKVYSDDKEKREIFGRQGKRGLVGFPGTRRHEVELYYNSTPPRG